MERSQSCTHFDADQNITSTTTTTATTTMTAINFHSIKQKSASGSNMNINPPLNSSLTNLSVRRKRKMLQRQQSREYADDDMDYEYAADHEDEEEDELDMDEDVTTTSGEESQNQTLNSKQVLQVQPVTLKKSMAFQRRKPQTSNPLLLSTLSMPNDILPATNYCCSMLERQRRLRHEDSFDSSSSAGIMSIGSPGSTQRQFSLLKRDNSIHSDSSRYSSVDSLLEARKPDPEAILINLGFGPVGSEDILSRIPKRFLKPSQVRGNDTEAFVRRLQLASSLADHSVLGYRGLTGNPDIPPSTIVAKIMRRFEVNERKKSMASIEHTIQ